MPRAELRVEILRSTLEAELVIALAAKLCYAGGDLDSLREKIEKKDQEKFIRQLTEMGHMSVLEHASFTFLIEGVSRSLLAQLTRHRIASFSVQSQRYVSYDKGFSYIIPPAIEALGEDDVREYECEMAEMQSWYQSWQEKLGGKSEKANEDARFVLPNACSTRLMVTMNVRELLHFFSLRCCSRAQWEIRALARKMLAECFRVCPALFENAGPECVRGRCSEGAKSCGRPEETRAEIAALKSGETD